MPSDAARDGSSLDAGNLGATEGVTEFLPHVSAILINQMFGDNGVCCWFNKLILECFVEPGILLLVKISALWDIVGINDMA